MGRTADVWVGFSRGDESLTDVVVTWEPTTRTGSAAATRLDVERLRTDGTVEGPAQSIGRARDAGNARCTLDSFSARAKSSCGSPATTLEERCSIAGQRTSASPRSARIRWRWQRRAFCWRARPSSFAASARRPTLRRPRRGRLRKTDRLLVELEVLQRGPTPELVTELLNQKGESLVTLPVPAGTGNKTRFEVPLQSLAPAVYVLRVRARTADRQVEQHDPFRIVP